MKRKALFSILVLALVCMVGCATGPIADLQLVVGAAEVALPLIAPAAGIDQATVTAVTGYLGAVSTAAEQASTILAGSGTAAEKAADIAQAFAGIAAPIVPARYQAIANAVQQVAQYVARLLASTKTAAPVPTATRAHAARQASLSASDLAKLQEIKARAHAVALACKR